MTDIDHVLPFIGFLTAALIVLALLGYIMQWYRLRWWRVVLGTMLWNAHAALVAWALYHWTGVWAVLKTFLVRWLTA